MPFPSWFLLLVFAHAGSLMIEEVSALDVWDESPSCDELRQLWDAISRSVRTSELTNEIPLVPYFDILPSLGHRNDIVEKGRRKQVRYPENHLLTNAIQGTFMEKGPPSQLNPPKEPLFVLGPPQRNTHDMLGGHFGDFGERTTSEGDMFTPLGAAATRKKGGLAESSWGLPEEVGMFGKFVDFDAEYPLASQSLPGAHFGSPSLDDDQEPCFQVLNKDCTVNEQCLCNGWNTLQCFHGKCNNQQLKTETENEHGSWHNGPLPRSKLGRLKRLRRNRESTFM